MRIESESQTNPTIYFAYPNNIFLFIFSNKNKYAWPLSHLMLSYDMTETLLRICLTKCLFTIQSKLYFQVTDIHSFAVCIK